MRRFRRKGLRVETKEDGSPVSEADLAADRAIRAILGRAFPAHGLLTEESGLSRGDGRHLWIADPVDGTQSFIRGLPCWAVLLALEVDGRLEVSVIHAPAQGTTLWARRGKGAFENGQPLRVSGRPLKAAWITHGWTGDFFSHRLEKGLARLAGRAKLVTGAFDALAFAAVARGQVEAFIEGPGPKVWDHAAPRLIVEEAGGRFTNLAGTPGHRGPGSIASNGRIHAALAGAFRKSR
jgi:histidinol-phosphatase